MPEEKSRVTRRDFIRSGIRGTCLLGLGGSMGLLLNRIQGNDTVWQIDPEKCIACEKCMDHCVLEVSAVKCFHKFAMCGYCKLCTGYFEPQPNALDTGAENQVCPTGAIKRGFVEHPYYEYIIDESLCVGCGKCVKGCTAFGNGSLFLQVRHDRCLNCNECAIAVVCPAGAFKRVPADRPYLLKGGEADRSMGL